MAVTQAAPNQAKQAPAPAIPFRVGVQPAELIDFSNVTALSTSTATPLPVYNVTPNVWQKGFWLNLQFAYPSNAVATLVAKENAPFSVINNITFTDINSKPIVGGAAFSGFDLYCVNKYFGYFNNPDSKNSAAYAFPLTGTPTAAQFFLYLPLEVVTRTGLGALENKSTASTFKLQIVLDAQTAVFSTPPTNPTQVTTNITSDSYFSTKVPGTAGAPPAAGATQYNIKGIYTLGSGAQSPIIQQGLGYPIRNMLLVNYDNANGTRATGETDMPDPLQFIYLGTSMFNRQKQLWKERMSRYLGLSNATIEGPNGLNNGVYLVWFNGDFSNGPGDELGNAYLGTEGGSLLQFVGSWAAATNLHLIVNYVAAPNNNPASLRAGGR